MTAADRAAALPGALLPWFRENARELPWRADRAPYHVWLSEIMLQQTRVEAVRGYYARFLAALPDIRSLADAPPDLLMKLWEGLGYYSRVRNLQAAARCVMAEHGGVFPSDYAAIRALPGIGDYTAGAIASICFEQPTPAVDGNVLRVWTRLNLDDRPPASPALRRDVREALAAVYPAGQCGAFTQSLMELGATVCVPNGAPDCARCPCADVCLSRDGAWRDYPVRAEKKPRRREARTLLLLRCGERIAVEKRPPHGLLAGLWQLPNAEGHLAPEDAVRTAADWGAEPADLLCERRHTHIFTHIEWDMICYELRCRAESLRFRWASPAELETDVALPTAFRWALD